MHSIDFLWFNKRLYYLIISLPTRRKMPILRKKTKKMTMSCCPRTTMKKTKAYSSLTRRNCRTNFSLTTKTVCNSLSMKTRKNCSLANSNASVKTMSCPNQTKNRKNSLYHGIRTSVRLFRKDV